MIVLRIVLFGMLVSGSAVFSMDDQRMQLYVGTEHSQSYFNNGYNMNGGANVCGNPYSAQMNPCIVYGHPRMMFYNSPDSFFSMEILKQRRQEIINIVLETVVKNDIPTFEFYYTGGGDVNAKGDVCGNNPYLKQVTPLMVAASCGRPRILKILLASEELVLDTQDPFGDTALIRAAKAGWASFVKLLLKAGANSSIRNKAGRTALDEAENSPLRGQDYYETWSKNHSFTEMIKYLKKAQNKKAQNNKKKTAHHTIQHYYLPYY